ncbi:MAG: Sapep family Mn(2+)-dependent dipeptidase [Lachnospiraceae bacterium]|nr:Sapep family Mn(2+)-dependent dipeptidase [Lachnospiraceae bacterium]
MDRILRDIGRLVAVRSVMGDAKPGKPFGDDVAAAVDVAARIAGELGFESSNVDGYVLEVNLNDKPDALGIMCHLDVVPEGNGWTTPPYVADVRDGRIYGRGTADNKGPAVCALYALKCVKDMGVALTKNVRLMLGTNEENGSSDLTEYFKRRSVPPVSFSPDAAFPVYNIEKGRYGKYFAAGWADAGDAAAAGPAPGAKRGGSTGSKAGSQDPGAHDGSCAARKICCVDAGIALNVVPDVATAVVEGFRAGDLLPYLKAAEEKTGVKFSAKSVGGAAGAGAADGAPGAGLPGQGGPAPDQVGAGVEVLDTDGTARFEITAKGVGTHASFPEEGNNALTALVSLLNSMPFADCAAVRALWGVGEVFPHGDTAGVAAGVAMSDEESGPLTLSLDILHMDEKGIKGGFDARCPIISDEKNTSKVLAAALAKHGLLVEDTEMVLPHYVPADSPFIKTLLRVYEEETGLPGECVSMGGGTYVHDIPGSVAFGAAFPDTETNAHAADEYSVIDELAANVRIYVKVILEMCK